MDKVKPHIYKNYYQGRQYTKWLTPTILKIQVVNLSNTILVIQKTSGKGQSLGSTPKSKMATISQK